MSRREALEVTRGDEARPIQPRRFSIVLRKPLAARNDGGAPKSAFKSSKTMGGGVIEVRHRRRSESTARPSQAGLLSTRAQASPP